jgi:polyphosphate kinase 2
MNVAHPPPKVPAPEHPERLSRKDYEKQLIKLQTEICYLQDWVRQTGARIIIVCEGRDTAGKGGLIKRFTERVSPRTFRIIALAAPDERERTKLFMQRYIEHFPAAGEVVIFDRSWYNRAGVERVMGYTKQRDVKQFLKGVPVFEHWLVEAGVILIKLWLEVDQEEQDKRLEARIDDPLKQWKLSPMDLESRRRWEDYTKAKEIMLARTNIPEARWWVVNGDDKKIARLNCILHLLSQVDYENVETPLITIPQRQHHSDYHRQPVAEELKVPEVY